MLIDIRAKEIASWRKNARRLAVELAEIEAVARRNDSILLALHQVSLVLIGRPDGWRGRVETLLRRRLGVAFCEVCPLTDSTVRGRVDKLPARGRATETAIEGLPCWEGAVSYFYLPVRQEGRAVGVLALAAKRRGAFPAAAARDFIHRLGELVAAALAAEGG